MPIPDNRASRFTTLRCSRRWWVLDALNDADENVLLFQNMLGSMTRPNAIQKRWPEVKKSMEKQGVLEERRIVPHTFHKTMATALVRGMGAQYTALYIGHGTSTQTLFRHYVPREIVVPDVRSGIIAGFGPIPFRWITVGEQTSAFEQ